MLYFVRHGETDDNVNHILTGRQNTPLNENGLKQVEQSGIEAKDLKIGVIFCSPLDRARKTCEAINKYHYKDVIYTEELIERSYGLYENRPSSSIDREACWNYFEDYKKDVMETPRELFGRVYAFLDKIKKEYKNKNILIVAHNGIGRAIYCYFNGIPADGNLLSFEMPNAKVITYNFED